MKYRELGTTGMNISQITLGTWGMGDVGWDHYDESTRIDAIRTAAQCGVNLIDTAPAYNNGAAERLVGRALAQLGIRNELYISTKCGNVFVDGKVYCRDGSAAMIRRQCEESLVNLQTDHIDVMLIHWPDPDTPFEETLGALNELKKEGEIPKFVNKIRSVSFSAKQAIKNGQKVLYVTERCVFRLTPRGLKLIESYPGIDVQKDIINKLPFEVEM